MNYEELNDYELVDLAKTNPEACEILYKKYQPLVYKLAKQIFATNNKGGIELKDVVQEGNIGLSHAIQYYNPGRDNLFFTYARVCIQKAMISYVIGINRQKHRVLNDSVSVEVIDNNDEFNGLDKVLKDEASNPINILIGKEDTARMYEKLKSRLTDFEQMVLELRDYGLNYKEMSEILDRDIKAIDNAFQRIRNKAKQLKG